MGLATLTDRVDAEAPLRQAESLARGGADVARKGAHVAKQGVKHGVRAAAPGIEVGARLGYFAKGLLYLTIGGLALQAALGWSEGEQLDAEGALREMHAQWYGTALVVAMTLGLAGHALWRLIQGSLDPEREARDAKVPLLMRLSFLTRGTLQALLVAECVRLLLGEHEPGDDTKSMTAEILSWEPIGVALVALMGAIVVCFGLTEALKAATEDFLRKLDARPGAFLRRLAVLLARTGTGIRAALFVVVGGYLVSAAIENDPSHAKGIGSALGSLHGWHFGWLALGAAAIGLGSYGAYQLIVSRYRRVTVG